MKDAEIALQDGPRPESPPREDSADGGWHWLCQCCRGLGQRALRPWGRLFGARTCQGTMALADQVVFSAVSFLTTVLIGRVCGKAELGIYALGFSLVMLAYSAVQNLIAVPYTVYGNRLHGRARAELAGAVLVHLGVLCVLVVLGMLGAIAVMSRGVGPQELIPVLWVLAATMPFVLLRDFARRICFTHLRAGSALALDLSVAVFQTAGLLLLVVSGRLSAVTANLLIGLVSAAAALTWLVWVRHDFVVRRDRILPEGRRNLVFGSWVFAGSFVADLSSNTLILWILAVGVGPMATGVFAAAAYIVRLCNPLLLGVSQSLMPLVAHAHREEGARGVRRVVGKVSLFLGLTMGTFSVAMFFAGGWAMRLFYGSQFAGYGQVITVMALAATASALALGPGASLLTWERPGAILQASVLGLIVTGTAALLFPWNIMGIVCAMLAGQVAMCVMQWSSFSRLARREP